MEPSKTSESHLTGHANVIKDFFHKWLLVINSFASLKFSLINLVFELIFQKKNMNKLAAIYEMGL